MKFNEKLNEYIDILDCTAKELSRNSGISTATISRYRNGERVPEINSDALNQLCSAIAQTAKQKQIKRYQFERCYKESGCWWLRLEDWKW